MLTLSLCLKKKNTRHNNPKNSSTTKINKHTPSVYSLFTHCLFDTAKNKLDYYTGKNCMKKFCLDLKEHATKVINYEKKGMTPLTKEKKKIHCEQKVCYICKKSFSTDDGNKKYFKVRKINISQENIEELLMISAHCNLRYKTPKEIPVVFHNGSTYDYHFMIRELAEEFEGQF